MRRTFLASLLLVPLLAAAPLRADPATPAGADDANPFQSRVRPVLSRYCLSCHGPEKRKGDFDLSKFQDLKPGEAKDVWQEVASRMRDKEMPPEKKPQPSEEERRSVVAWVEKTVGLAQVDCHKIASDESQKFYRGYVMCRRLNRTEYNNTVRDLFDLDLRPGDDLPEDGSGGEGFDTDGNALFVSSIQIEKYLQAADKVLAVVLPDGKGRTPEPSPFAAAQSARRRVLVAEPDGGLAPREAAKKDLTAFASRAFRRPVRDEEVDRLLTMFDRGQARGDTFDASLRLALKAVLISPHFLFLVEPEPPSDGIYPLGDYPLASRLSYFLWSSMPDDELVALASGQRLADPEILRQQVRRMLKDPRARALGENFACQWLGITPLGVTIRPDPKKFPEFTDALGNDMREEAVLLFNSVVLEDRSLTDLLDADYTFLNARLARHYGIDGVSGPEMRKVSLADRNRGGVLGLGAVLTCTSYPLRTSPVLRGRWVLEQLLGEKIPPPPPDVPQLPKDEKPRDGLTFRQQLERHRSEAECAGCHRRMDPIGFGLENFDPEGRWRSTSGGKPVDADGELTTGEKFTGPAELRQILLKRREQFLGNFCRKLLGYGLGRGLNKFDACVVDDCMKTLAAEGNRPSVLFEQIALSTPFRYRYAKK